MPLKTETLSVVALASLALVSILAVGVSAMPATTNGIDQTDGTGELSRDCDQTMDMTKAQDRDMDRDRDGSCDTCTEVNCHDYLYESPGPHSP
jgi:hypothetical protein